MSSTDMEYKLLMILSVCLLIMGACEMASFKKWGGSGIKSGYSLSNNQPSRRFRMERVSADGYGYNGLLEDIREHDCSRFENSSYMDYTGAGQYRDSQIEKTFRQIKNIPFGNTHSDNEASKNSEREMENARELILKWFHTTSDKYDVVFTSGATAGLHLIGESFPWSKGSHFYYLRENHNSVLGIREIATHNGASFHVVNSTDVEYACGNSPSIDHPEEKIHNLFAYPLEENYSGKIFPKEWIQKIQGRNKFDCAGKWYVLLDIAAYAPTHDFSLSEYPADFVVLSFYKLFGFPTGLGALLIRKDSGAILNKVYYGGGSVLQTVTKYGEHRVPLSTTRRFEDGTPNFLGVLSIKYGFEALTEVGGLISINQHTDFVTDYLYKKIVHLVHKNGRPVAVVYGNHHLKSTHPGIQGPIVSLNVLKSNGEFVSFTEVESKASNYHIHLRAGWHCNPGAAYASVGMSEDAVAEQIREHNCVDAVCAHQSALTVVNGVMAGAVRISLGYMTTIEDCDRVVDFLRKEYVN